MGAVLGNPGALCHIAEQHVFRSRKRQEDLIRGRPAPRAVDDLNLSGLQEIHRLHDLVKAFDRIFDCQHATAVGGMQRKPMVRIVEAYEGSIAHPVADAAIE